MRVQVLYFGVLKERSNVAEETIELSGGATVGELVEVLRERTSKSERTTGSAMANGLENVWGSLAVAVNREYASADALLRDGDEVALLPPVSGGCFAQGGSLAPLGPSRTAKRALCAHKAVCHAR